MESRLLAQKKKWNRRAKHQNGEVCLYLKISINDVINNWKENFSVVFVQKPKTEIHWFGNIQSLDVIKNLNR